MKHLFVSYQIAKDLKELDFNEPCLGFFNKEKELFLSFEFSSRTTTNTLLDILNSEAVAAPLYQQVVDFLREKHDIHIWISSELGYHLTYCWHITGESTGSKYGSNFKTYYEALEAAIKESIKLIKKD